MTEPTVVVVREPEFLVVTAPGPQGPQGEAGAGGGVTDHGDLTGLGDDDHPQYETSAEAAAKVTAHEAAADPHTAYQTAAETAAELAAHAAASDPHAGYATDGDLAAHAGAADPHPTYETSAEAAAKVAAHEAAGDPHPSYETAAETTAKVAAHEADTTDVHGIADTGALATAAGVTAAVGTHEAAGNPHPTYHTAAEVAADIATHAAASDPHAGYATDGDLAAHAGAADPHPTYETSAEAAAKVAAHEAAADPHTGYVTDAGLAAHEAAGDPHTGYATDADVSAHTGDTSAAHAASAVSFTPTGLIIATDVQAALAELDAEKALLLHAANHSFPGGADLMSTVTAAGITGATESSRYVGATSGGGPPTTGTFTAGDFTVDVTRGMIWTCITSGSPGSWRASNRVDVGTYAAMPAASAVNTSQLYFATDYLGGALFRSNGTLYVITGAPADAYIVALGGHHSFAPSPYETLPRAVAANAAVAAGTTGQLRMVGIWLPEATLVTSISFLSGTTALAGGTHGWAALFSSARALLRQSTDDTGVTWTASTVKTFTLSSTYTTTAAGYFYLGLLLTGSTMPNLTGSNTTAAATGIAPISSGTSDTGLTGTAPSTAAALTAVIGTPYAYVT